MKTILSITVCYLALNYFGYDWGSFGMITLIYLTGVLRGQLDARKMSLVDFIDGILRLL